MDQSLRAGLIGRGREHGELGRTGAAHGIGDAARLPERLRQTVRGSRAQGAIVGLKYDAGEREALTRGECGDFLRAPVQPRIVVEPTRAIDQPLGAEAIDLELPLDIDAEAQD